MATRDPTVALQQFVGVDIAAASFTALWTVRQQQGERPITLDQTPTGFAALHQHLQATQVDPAATLVVLEATSSYWVALAVALHQWGYHVSVVNPMQVHHFAKSHLRRAKTDDLDALLLLQFATERQPAVWNPPPEVYHEVRQRLMARDALVEMRQHARNHRHALLQWPVVVESVRQHMDTTIQALDQQIALLDAEIRAAFQATTWASSLALLLSIPGVGTLTAAWIIVATLNFTIAPTAEALTAYAGLAPAERRSGTSLRGRPTIGPGGHARLRKALYMATLSAGRHNPMIKECYERLRQAGKPNKVARCAAARKLLHVARAIILAGQPFDPAYGAHRAIAQDWSLSDIGHEHKASERYSAV